MAFQSRFVEPYKSCFELGGGLWRTRGVGDNVTATDIQLFLQGEGDGLRRAGLIQIAIEGGNGGDSAGAARGKSDNRAALADGAGGDLASEAAIVVVGTDDALNWQAEGFVGVEGTDGYLFEMFEEREAGVPRGTQAGLDDVVSIQSTDGDGDETSVAELLYQRGKINFDPAIDYLREIDEVHLVDRHDEMADA